MAAKVITISAEELVSLGQASGPSIDIKAILEANLKALKDNMDEEKAAAFLKSGKKIKQKMAEASEAIQTAGLKIYVPGYPNLGENMLNMNRANAIIMIYATNNKWRIETAVYNLLPEQMRNHLVTVSHLVTSGVQFLARYYLSGRSNDKTDRTDPMVVFKENLGNDGLGKLWVCALCVDWVAASSEKGTIKTTFELFATLGAANKKGTSNAMLANLGVTGGDDPTFSHEDEDFIVKAFKCVGMVGKQNTGGQRVCEINKGVKAKVASRVAASNN